MRSFEVGGNTWYPPAIRPEAKRFRHGKRKAKVSLALNDGLMVARWLSLRRIDVDRPKENEEAR